MKTNNFQISTIFSVLMELRKCLQTACAMETSLEKAETSFRTEKLLKVRLTEKCVTEKHKTSNRVLSIVLSIFLRKGSFSQIPDSR